MIGKTLFGDPYLELDAYADRLAEQGLGAIVEEDEKVAILFEPCYQRLSEVEREMFLALSLYPYVDFGANIVCTYRDIEPWSARKILVRLEQASLVIRSQSGRYRYHNFVRDFAWKKLSGSDRTRILDRFSDCWTTWDMMETELNAIGPAALISEYVYLLRFSPQHAERLIAWGDFVLHDNLYWSWTLVCSSNCDRPASRQPDRCCGPRPRGKWARTCALVVARSASVVRGRAVSQSPVCAAADRGQRARQPGVAVV